MYLRVVPAVVAYRYRSLGTREKFFILVAQDIFLHLAHSIARQLIHMDDGLRLFETRQLVGEGRINRLHIQFLI